MRSATRAASCRIDFLEPRVLLAATITSSTVGSVPIGGGGFVTGLVSSQGTVYSRTDIGGAYRWDNTNATWIPLTEHFNIDQQTYYGIESIAVSASNPDKVWIAAGKKLTDSGGGAIFKSTDGGLTWSSAIKIPTGVGSNKVRMGAAEGHRWTGERLVVHPTDDNILYFASRSDGLYKSTDGGTTWSKLTFPGTLQSGIGITSLAFTTAGTTLYAGAYGDGIYQTTNGGTTWTKMTGGPTKPNRLVWDYAYLIVTSDYDAAGSPGLMRWSSGNGWQNTTPSSAATADFCAVAVNPENRYHVIAATVTSAGAQFYRSTNSGSSWSQMTLNRTSTVPWWSSGIEGAGKYVSALVYDSTDSNRVWYADWYGTWRTEEVAGTSDWTSYEAGHEEVVPFSLATPDTGVELIVGVGDVEGFRFDNGTDAYPTTILSGYESGDWMQDTRSIAYRSNSSVLARAAADRYGAWKGSLQISTDNGATWDKTSGWSTSWRPVRVAMAANDSNNLVTLVQGAAAKYTLDGGATWTSIPTDSTGIPTGPTADFYFGQPLVADRSNPNRFYYYHNGSIYRSTNGGASWYHATGSLPAVSSLAYLRAGTNAGELWLSLAGNTSSGWVSGIWHSTNSGSTWTQMSGVTYARMIAVGKKPDANSPMALYMYGTVTGGYRGVYVSQDNAATWTYIGDLPDTPGGQPEIQIGDAPTDMAASLQEFGHVFIATNGRGVYQVRVQTEESQQGMQSQSSSPFADQPLASNADSDWSLLADESDVLQETQSLLA